MYADGIVHKSTTLTLDVVMVQNDNTRQCVILSTIHPELPPPHCFGVKKPWACACYQLFWRHHPARLQVAQRHDKIVADGQACSCEDAVRYRVWHWPCIGGIDGSNVLLKWTGASKSSGRRGRLEAPSRARALLFLFASVW